MIEAQSVSYLPNDSIDKENAVFRKPNVKKVENIKSRRFFSLSNTNSDKTRNSLSWERTISLNEEGGWKDGSLENIANRILSSVADSLVKHRRSLCINNSFTEDNFSAPISIIGRKYSCGNDDEVFDNVSKLSSQSNDSSFRGRYLTAADSVSELNDDFVDNHQVVSIEKYVISLPDGVCWRQANYSALWRYWRSRSKIVV